MAFVMDPIEKRGHRGGHHLRPDARGPAPGPPGLLRRPRRIWASTGAGSTARVQPATLRREAGRHVDLEPPRQVLVDDEFDVVFQRKDPPVDADYVTATQILSLCRRALVLNRPEGILAANEKLYALHFPELMTETLVTREIAEADRLHGEAGRRDDREAPRRQGRRGDLPRPPATTGTCSRSSSSRPRFGTRWTMAQRYLPDVREGDKRILLVDGEPLGRGAAGARRGRDPREPPRRGTAGEGRSSTTHDRRIIERLAPRLRRDGLFFVGIDVIGRPAHRDQRHQPDGDPGDEPPRRRPLRGDRVRPGRGLLEAEPEASS